MNRKLIKDLMDAIKASDRKKTSGYDTSAVVRRIEDGTAWVHIPGGVDETPVKLTINASVGDTVQVRVSGGRAFLVGNRTAPPTDDTTAIKATYVAKNAQETAVEAKSEASEAWHYAGTAKEAAESAQDSADSAAEAAIEAWNHADDAHQAAVSANNSANNALVQLSVVEDVAGTLRWISEHGSFVPTTDTTVIEGAVYFIYENGDYVPIANPDPSANPSQEGWYVLDVTESQAKYIMAHLAVTSAGLWVLPVNQMAEHPLVDSDDNQIVDSDDNPIVDFSEDPQHASGYKVLLSGGGGNTGDFPIGLTIYNDEGEAVANYGTTTTIGSTAGYNTHINTQGFFVRNGLVPLAKYGSTTIFYEPDGVTEAAEIGANGMHVKEGEIGGWTIDNTKLYRDDLSLDNNGLVMTYDATKSGAEYGMTQARIWGHALSNTNTGISMGTNTFHLYCTDTTGNLYSRLVDLFANASRASVTVGCNQKSIELLANSNGNVGLYNDQWVDWTLRNASNGDTYLQSDGSLYLKLLGITPTVLFYQKSDTSNIILRPSSPNSIYLGTSENPWKAVYGQTVTQTSDGKQKDIVEDHDWKIDEFIHGLKPVAFKFKDGDSGRIHMGFVAQDVAKLANDLEIGDLSLYEASIVESNGDDQIEGKAYHGEEIDDEKLAWGLKYNELIAPMVLEIQKLMKRVDELEARLAKEGENYGR